MPSTTANMPLFKASIITPEAVVLEAKVVEAQIPAVDGMLGILYMRAPLLAKLGTGVLRLTTADEKLRFFVSGGYAQMKGEELSILATEALSAKEVTQEMIAREQAKLNAVTGENSAALQQKQTLQARITAMMALTAASQRM